MFFPSHIQSAARRLQGCPFQMPRVLSFTRCRMRGQFLISFPASLTNLAKFFICSCAGKLSQFVIQSGFAFNCCRKFIALQPSSVIGRNRFFSVLLAYKQPSLRLALVLRPRLSTSLGMRCLSAVGVAHLRAAVTESKQPLLDRRQSLSSH
jgi:hypothetical protein